MSKGKTTWNHSAQQASPIFGNPTSQLTYSDMKALVVEFGFTVHAQEYFGNARIGAGSIDGGILRDEDWFAGQVKFSDTNSVIRGDELHYWMLDAGKNFVQTERITIGAFFGFGQYYEVIDAYGVSNNLAGGAIVLPDNRLIISNDARWSFARLGVNGKLRPLAPLVLSAEIAFLPVLDLKNEDSHYGRPDLGPVPNIHMEGSGDGLMWQVEGRYAISKGGSVFVAYRDWRLKADGTIRFGASPGSLPLNKFETTRSGARLGFSYRF